MRVMIGWVGVVRGGGGEGDQGWVRGWVMRG